MGTILERIIERKKIEVQLLKKAGTKMTNTAFQTYSLIHKLRVSEDVAIIAEFKRASPSKGDINLKLVPEAQAKLYAEADASAISVLTDEKGFKGSFADLQKVRKTVNIPILCKDFIVDRIQIDLAGASGADVILLIASVLNKEELAELHNYASSRGLECLVEIHDESDLEKAVEINAPLIGINNRDLKSFQVDLKNTEKLGPLVKKAGALLISESGIKTREDVLRAAASGASGILVGETFMTSSDIRKSFADFKIPIGGSRF
ncbi:indole-3-glycerol phosphate synthase TrpC [Mesobacillus subterraneus]|uniref:indole-3-glycerol phosphate synthase TrpC n=1 Tax=Mesobacillus subterraneus TaxID=285983 RepID=UPI00203BBAFC|nr:indole-3-glycerol phosphate synthase TrpC [Mesobacillus subterraneus]MCM3664289.1 indole-3-glycerol phosphate synthase TrpC [Mesobacillus subterraneus]MCM3682316.1 indole-3-glycerol phosphate synthase TrpC [Mesobacillus subterraneus]